MSAFIVSYKFTFQADEVLIENNLFNKLLSCMMLICYNDFVVLRSEEENEKNGLFLGYNGHR